MIINEASWEQLRKDIEHELKLDENITDVDIRYQVKKTDKIKNIVRFSVLLK
tara:strand:- start:245 stop:400 length:156 start_codon:yes stop_codon:yes gene_type:complete